MRIGTPTKQLGRIRSWASWVLPLGLVGCTPGGTGDDTSMTETMPTETVTIQFEGAEGTSNGTTDFSFRGVSFTGGTVRTVGQPDLYGSGLFAYEVLESSPVTVVFAEPVDLLELFFVTSGAGISVMSAFDADGNVVGSLTADSAGTAMSREVSLTGNVVRVEFTHTGSGDGWIDDFTFRVAQTH